MQSKAATVAAYIAELPPERAKAIQAVRAAIKKKLPKGYEEGMQWGMISYFVPLKLYPAGYGENSAVPLPYAALASQKNYMAVYLMSVHDRAGSEFVKAYKATGKKLDMGKGCVRFKKLDDLPLEVIGKAIASMPVKKWIAVYEASRLKTKSGQRAVAKKKGTPKAK